MPRWILWAASSPSVWQPVPLRAGVCHPHRRATRSPRQIFRVSGNREVRLDRNAASPVNWDAKRPAQWRRATPAAHNTVAALMNSSVVSTLTRVTIEFVRTSTPSCSVLRAALPRRLGGTSWQLRAALHQEDAARRDRNGGSYAQRVAGKSPRVHPRARPRCRHPPTTMRTRPSSRRRSASRSACSKPTKRHRIFSASSRVFRSRREAAPLVVAKIGVARAGGENPVVIAQLAVRQDDAAPGDVDALEFRGELRRWPAAGESTESVRRCRPARARRSPERLVERGAGTRGDSCGRAGDVAPEPGGGPGLHTDPAKPPPAMIAWGEAHPGLARGARLNAECRCRDRSVTMTTCRPLGRRRLSRRLSRSLPWVGRRDRTRHRRIDNPSKGVISGTLNIV